MQISRSRDWREVIVRKAIDCFITTLARGRELLHADGDFDPFEAHPGLRVVHPARRQERRQPCYLARKRK